MLVELNSQEDDENYLSKKICRVLKLLADQGHKQFVKLSIQRGVQELTAKTQKPDFIIEDHDMSIDQVPDLFYHLTQTGSIYIMKKQILNHVLERLLSLDDFNQAKYFLKERFRFERDRDTPDK